MVIGSLGNVLTPVMILTCSVHELSSQGEVGQLKVAPTALRMALSCNWWWRVVSTAVSRYFFSLCFMAFAADNLRMTLHWHLLHNLLWSTACAWQNRYQRKGYPSKVSSMAPRRHSPLTSQTFLSRSVSTWLCRPNKSALCKVKWCRSNMASLGMPWGLVTQCWAHWVTSIVPISLALPHSCMQ